MGESSPERWRAVIAALANDDARRAFARLVLDAGDPFDGLSPSRRAHVRDQLLSAEILSETEGAVTLRPETFANLLRESAVTRARGVERFVQDGRIRQYPSRPAERLELLRWVTTRTLRAGEVLTEGEITERLSSFSDDGVTLRRYLVDAGLVERTRTGSEYALPE